MPAQPQGCVWLALNSAVSTEVQLAETYAAGACWPPISLPFLLAWDMAGCFWMKAHSAGTTGLRTRIWRRRVRRRGMSGLLRQVRLSRDQPRFALAMCSRVPAAVLSSGFISICTSGILLKHGYICWGFQTGYKGFCRHHGDVDLHLLLAGFCHRSFRPRLFRLLCRR